MLLGKVNEISDIFLLGKLAIEHRLLRTFDVLHLIESTIPYLSDIPVNALLELINAQHDDTKNDFAGGMFFNKLEEKLMTIPDTCLNLRTNILSTATESTTNLYPVLLIALAKSSANTSIELALTDSKNPNKLISNSALWTLGRFVTLTLYDGEDLKSIYGEIILNISSLDEVTRRTALRAAASTMHMTDVFDNQFTTLAEANDQYVLGLLANAFYMQITEFKLNKCFGHWLDLLSNLSSENPSILDQLDFVLSQLIPEVPYQQKVTSCLTKWCAINAKDLARDKSVADIFDNTLFALVENQPLLSSLLTDWFLNNNQKLASSATGILSKLWVSGFRNPEFCMSHVDELTADELIFLVRRMLGHIYSEEHLLSLTFSLLKTKDAKNRTYGIVGSILRDEISQDFPHPTLDAIEKLKTSAENGELKVFLSGISLEINNWINELNALPRLNELRPSSQLRRNFEKARDKQMQESMNDAQKGSIFRQICTEIPIKAGTGFFSFHGNAYTEASQMQSISHSVAMPLRLTKDTVGHEMNGFFYRIAKKESQ